MLSTDQALQILAEASRVYARKYYTLTFDDIYSTATERWWIRRHNIKTKAEGGAPKAVLYLIVSQACSEMLKEETKHHQTHRFTTTMTRALLNSLGEIGDITSLEVSDLRTDLRNAMLRLPQEGREIIWRYYVDGELFKSGSTERRKLDRAVNVLTRLMNDPAGDYVGRRKVLSNAASRAAIKADM